MNALTLFIMDGRCLKPRVTKLCCSILIWRSNRLYVIGLRIRQWRPLGVTLSHIVWYINCFRCIAWALREHCAAPVLVQNVNGLRRLPISKAVAHGLARHSCTALCLVVPMRWGKWDGPKHYRGQWQSNFLTAQNNGTDMTRFKTAKFQSPTFWYIPITRNDEWHNIVWKISNICSSFSLSKCLSIVVWSKVYSSATPYFVVGPESPPRPLRN